MAKKKVIKKKRVTEEPVSETDKDTSSKSGKKVEEELDAFEVEEVEGIESEEVSEMERELFESEFDEEIQEERYYTIPLARKGYEKGPKWNRSKKAIKVIREFLTKHMKPEGEVYISQEVNERIWENGIKNPPRKIRLYVTKSVDGIVRAYLA